MEGANIEAKSRHERARKIVAIVSLRGIVEDGGGDLHATAEREIAADPQRPDNVIAREVARIWREAEEDAKAEAREDH